MLLSLCLQHNSFTVYKHMDKKVWPIAGQFPKEAHVFRNIPEDSLITLSSLFPNPPEFIPSTKITYELLKILNLNPKGFLWPKKEKLFQHIIQLNEEALAFEETDRGTLKESYFSPYIYPTVPYTPWIYKNIPILPGIKNQVVQLLQNKIKVGVYKPSQLAYWSR